MINKTGSQPDILSPSDAKNILFKRAKLIQIIREYFRYENVLEVQTPLLSSYPVTDPQLENIRVENPKCNYSFNSKEWLFLTTSPEYEMKKLLTLGSGSIYQICKAFRQDTPGPKHQIEFSILEWYRVGYDINELINDVFELLSRCIGINQIKKMSYREAFLEYLDFDPCEISTTDLEEYSKRLIDVSFESKDKNIWLDLLFSHLIEPKLGYDLPCFIINYPAEQAALAKIDFDEKGNPIAKRFELFINGIELANGYEELIESDEYLERFEEQNSLRKAMGLDCKDIDKPFIKGLEKGLPPCSGVAMGLDRLLLL